MIPAGPGNFFHQLLIALAEIGSYFIHNKKLKLFSCTGSRIRTHIKGFGDPYATIAPYPCVVGMIRLELMTCRVSDGCSNQLSYIPICVGKAGFEPTTSWSQTMHTTGLYYSPLCDSAAARTQDSYIKSVVLYQLSYEIILRK